MRSPKKSPRLNVQDYLAIYKNVLITALNSILSSKEYIQDYAGLLRDNRRLIKENLEEIAEMAADCFTKNGGAKLTNEREIDNLIKQCISQSVQVFK